MPINIPNGGGGDDPTTPESYSYNNAINKPQGERTPEEQQVIDDFEEKVQRVGDSKVDSGGPGGYQAAVALEVGRWVGNLEARRKESIDQWSRLAASGGPGARHAQSEMHGADTASIVELAWLVYELRERLNGSPY